MNNDVEDNWFDRALAEVHATAPDDVRAQIRRLTGGDEAVVPMPPETPRSRRWLFSAAATLVALVAGLVLLFGRGESPSIAPNHASTPSTDPPATTDVPATTLERTSVAPVSDPLGDVVVEEPSGAGSDVLERMGLGDTATSTGDDAVAALAVLEDYRISVLSASRGFSATSSVERTWVLADGSKPGPDAPPAVVDVTVLASGDVLAEFPNGDWFRHDAATGIARHLATNTTDGTRVAWESRFDPRAHQHGRVLGHDPMQLLGTDPGAFLREPLTVEVSATAFEQHGAVEVRMERRGLGIQRFVIDLASGLIVDFESTQVDEQGTSGLRSSLSDVVATDVLPVATEPPLPPGLEWQPFNDPSIATAASIEEAREAFGSGLVLPRSALDAGNVGMEHAATTLSGMGVELDHPDAASRYVMIYDIQPVGLLRTVVYLYTQHAVPGREIPSGYVEIDDRICEERTTCISATAEDADMTPTAGALAGVPFFGGFTNLDGMFLSIEAPTPQAVLAIADSFVAVDGD